MANSLNGTGLQGGPLVTAPNVTDRSDFRLYTSDSNATMQTLSDESAFRTTCYSIFERMVNTVPSTVTLSDPVTPLTWKAVDVALDIDSTGTVSVSGLIRNLYTTATPPATVSYTTSTAAGNSSSQTSGGVYGSGTSLYGNTTYWSFNTTVASPGTTSVNFEDVSYPVNDEVFILPSRSYVNASETSVLVRAAALTSLAADVTGVLYVPTAVQGTLNKEIQNVTVAMSAYATAGNYTLYEGKVVTTSVERSVISKVVAGGAASRTLKIQMFDGF